MAFYLLWVFFGRYHASVEDLEAQWYDPLTELVTGQPNLVAAPLWFIVTLLVIQGTTYIIRNSSTIFKGSVTEAIESGRTAICSYCAAHYAEEMGLELANLNVEDKDSVLAELGGGSQTEAPNTTGGN